MKSRHDKGYKFSRLILCEGKEDVAFLSALIATQNLPKSHLRHTGSKRNDRGGKDKFGERLRSLKLDPDFRRSIKHILVVADCDNDPDGSFKNICAQIQRAGFTPPNRVRRAGIGDVAITVYLIPPDEEGSLERYLENAARDANPNIAAETDQFVANVAIHNWSITQKSKLWLRVMVAACYKSDPCINLAPLFNIEEQRIISLEHDSFTGLVAILRQLGD